MKPFAESCEQNQADIFSIFKNLLASNTHLLEIASGTGQHAVYFAERLPHLVWQTSDLAENHQGINQWLDEAQLKNTRPPLELNVSDNWPNLNIDAVFSANAVHIMPWENVVDYIQNAASLLKEKGLFILYGPFNYNGEYSSESNAKFNDWLLSENPKSSIRDFEKLNEIANKSSMTLKHDFEMPANNRILCWEKI